VRGTTRHRVGEWTDHAWHASASPMHPAPNGAVSSTSIMVHQGHALRAAVDVRHDRSSTVHRQTPKLRSELRRVQRATSAQS